MICVSLPAVTPSRNFVTPRRKPRGLPLHVFPRRKPRKLHLMTNEGCFSIAWKDGLGEPFLNSPVVSLAVVSISIKLREMVFNSIKI
jgi:hypothetical protein